ncbi:MAG: hypothetical protein RLZZ241_666 [Bacteroidota bacterium]|jgi:tellurite resistance protein TerC
MIWIAFIAGIIIFLALDLGVFHKTDHVIRAREAAIWTGIWAAVALLFTFVIYWIFDSGLTPNPTGLTAGDAALKYITGYLIELSLSIDNVFVIAVIFSTFSIPPMYQHRVLFWGILGAILFRGLMIVFGVALITKFDWIIYLFGAFLLITAFRMLRHSEHEFNPENAWTLRQLRKIFPITTTLEGHAFFVRYMGVNSATPLFVTLVMIEFTDVLFALDSIPAILAITADPFIVFSSNILAILGLRSMYFLISRMLEKFRFINFSLVIILAYVGLKMIFAHQIHIPEWLSLSIIVSSLGGGIFASLLIPEKTNN